MKKMHILSVLFLSAGHSLLAQHKEIDVTHYSFNIILNDAHDTIYVEETIDFISTSKGNYHLDLIQLDDKGKGMVITEHNASELRHENDIITFSLPLAQENSDKKTLKISYKGVPANGLIIGKNKFEDRTFFADNWPNRARYWMACNDHPADKATIDYTVIAPSKYSCVATGLLNGEENNEEGFSKWVYRSKDLLPTKVMVIGVAEMSIKELETNFSFPLSSWVYPQDEKNISDLDVAVDVIEYFESLVAPYPFEKLANVQSTTMFGGMENAGNIFYDENAVTGKKTMDALIAHEIAHQWFGNSASEKDWKYIWLSEGFATYFADLFMGHKYGEDQFNKRLEKERKQVIQFYYRQATPVVQEDPKDLMSLLNPNSYQKGAWILHMLRMKIGDEAFFNGIKNYYAKYQFSNAITADLQKEMEAASGQDLMAFFMQWVYQAGHPQLYFDWKQKKSKVSVLLSQQQNHFIFEFPIELMIRYADGSSELKTLSFDGNDKKITLDFKSKKKIKSIELDPYTKLLFDRVGA